MKSRGFSNCWQVQLKYTNFDITCRERGDPCPPTSMRCSNIAVGILDARIYINLLTRTLLPKRC